MVLNPHINAHLPSTVDEALSTKVCQAVLFGQGNSHCCWVENNGAYIKLVRASSIYYIQSTPSLAGLAVVRYSG